MESIHLHLSRTIIFLSVAQKQLRSSTTLKSVQVGIKLSSFLAILAFWLSRMGNSFNGPYNLKRHFSPVKVFEFFLSSFRKLEV